MALPDLILSRLAGTLAAFFGTEGGLEGKEISTPSNPPTGYQYAYPKADGNWYKLDDGGTESLLGGSGSSAGQVPLGTIILSYTGAITGAATLAQIRAAGFAVCDGTTASSQGISDPTITSAMPDLNGNERFLCGHDTTAGSTGAHQMESHTHTVPSFGSTHNRDGTGADEWYSSQSGTTSNPTDCNSGTETRPINISVVCCMRVK